MSLNAEHNCDLQWWTADEDLTIYEARVAQQGDCSLHCEVATPSGEAVGIIKVPADQHGRVGIITRGRTYVTLAATVSNGDQLVVSGDYGLVTGATDGLGQQIIGRAREAGDEGDKILADILLGETPEGPAKEFYQLTAGEDLQAAQYTPVSEDEGATCSLVETSSAVVAGVLQNAPDADETAIVQTTGQTRFMPGTPAPSVGDEVMATTGGELIAATGSGANVFIVGEVVAAGSSIRLMLCWKWFPAA